MVPSINFNGTKFSYAEGYAWCVEVIKQSVYANLAMELEMNKAIEHLHQGDLIAANQVFFVRHHKSKITLKYIVI